MNTRNLKRMATRVVVLIMAIGVMLAVALPAAAESNPYGSTPPRTLIAFMAPDLTISSLTMSPNPTTFGSDVTVTIEVKNNGSIGASDTQILFRGGWYTGQYHPVLLGATNGFQCETSGEGGTIFGAQVFCWGGSIPAHGTATVSFRLHAGYRGTFSPTVTADPYKRVSETNENNNILQTPVGYFTIQ